MYLDSEPGPADRGLSSRASIPEATFTPENTYFREDRVKQVVGVKVQLKGSEGFAKPGMPADGEILVGGERMAGQAADAREPATGISVGPGDGRAAIRVRRPLRKRYGTSKPFAASRSTSREGEIFGLIGPDGAGKTSTFQILAGVMEATSGVAEVFGRPARDARAETGYLTQTFSLYPDLTVRENLQYLGDLRGVPRAEVERRGLRYLRMFDMDRFTERLAGRLSGGMKQKLALACALVPEPQGPPARRADDRRRSGLAPRVLGHARASGRGRSDDPRGDAVSGRGRALPPGGADARRRDPADRHAGGAAARASAPRASRSARRAWATPSRSCSR